MYRYVIGMIFGHIDDVCHILYSSNEFDCLYLVLSMSPERMLFTVKDLVL